MNSRRSSRSSPSVLLVTSASLAFFNGPGLRCVPLVPVRIREKAYIECTLTNVLVSLAANLEGLLVVTTVTLALRVLRMAKRKAIVTKLCSVESLRSVSVICPDKTGVFTGCDNQ